MAVELTHDIIALKIWELIPEYEKQIRSIVSSIDRRHNDYKSGNGSLLGEKELLAWDDYIPNLKLEQSKKDYIKKSSKALVKSKKNKKRLIYGLVGLTLLAIAFSVASILFYLRAKSISLELENFLKERTIKEAEFAIITAEQNFEVSNFEEAKQDAEFAEMKVKNLSKELSNIYGPDNEKVKQLSKKVSQIESETSKYKSVSSETSKIVKELLIRGDQYLAKSDFVNAASSYLKANQLVSNKAIQKSFIGAKENGIKQYTIDIAFLDKTKTPSGMKRKVKLEQKLNQLKSMGL